MASWLVLGSAWWMAMGGGFLLFGNLAAGRRVVYLVGITCMLLISSLVRWYVAGDLPVPQNLGGGVVPLLLMALMGMMRSWV